MVKYSTALRQIDILIVPYSRLSFIYIFSYKKTCHHTLSGTVTCLHLRLFCFTIPLAPKFFYPKTLLASMNTSFALLKVIYLTISVQKICPVPFLFICHKHLPCLSGFRYAWNDNIIRLSAIYRQLHENGSIKKGDVSESTVNRYINLLALKLKTTSNQDMRRYERPHINEVWCGDSSIGP